MGHQICKIVQPRTPWHARWADRCGTTPLEAKPGNALVKTPKTTIISPHGPSSSAILSTWRGGDVNDMEARPSRILGHSSLDARLARPYSVLTGLELHGLMPEELLRPPWLYRVLRPNFIVKVPSISWCRMFCSVSGRWLGCGLPAPDRVDRLGAGLRAGGADEARCEALERHDVILAASRDVDFPRRALDTGGVEAPRKGWLSSLRSLDEEKDFRTIRLKRSLIAIFLSFLFCPLLLSASSEFFFKAATVTAAWFFVCIELSSRKAPDQARIASGGLMARLGNGPADSGTRGVPYFTRLDRWTKDPQRSARGFVWVEDDLGMLERQSGKTWTQGRAGASAVLSIPMYPFGLICEIKEVHALREPIVSFPLSPQSRPFPPRPGSSSGPHTSKRPQILPKSIQTGTQGLN